MAGVGKPGRQPVKGYGIALAIESLSLFLDFEDVPSLSYGSVWFSTGFRVCASVGADLHTEPSLYGAEFHLYLQSFSC